MRELWAAAYRSRYWIAGIMAGFLALAIIIALLSTRLYRADALIEVREEAEKVLGTEADRESASSKQDVDRFLQTQLDIVRSRAVAEAVAESLGLFRGDAFLEAMHEDPEDDEIIRGLTPRESHRERILKVLRDEMSVRYTGDTRIAVISFTSPDPRLSVRVANAFAEAFIRSNLARKAGSSDYALEFLRGQLREAQERLAKSEQAAVDYARRTRIVDASNAAGSSNLTSDQARPQSLITAQLVQLNQAYAAAKANRVAAEQKWRQVSGSALLSIPDVLSNAAVQALLERRAQAQALYQQQLATRREGFPAVAEAGAQVRELDRQLQTVAKGIRSSVHSDYEVALARENQLAGVIDKLKSSTLAEQNQGIELSILRREADTNRQQYEALLRRYNSLNAESGVQTNNLSIVDRAQVPDRPSWPKLSLNIALALILGGIFSALFVYVREHLFNSIRTPDEVQTRTGLPILGVVPASDEPKVDLVDPKSPQSDAYSSVRTSLSLISANGLPKTLMVTSTQQGEGKSTACHALGLSFARLGKRVVIVDIDLRRPNAHRLFDLPNALGVTSVLTGQVPLAQAIQKTALPNLDLLSAGEIPPTPTELISSPQMQNLISDLANLYEIVLIDSAPVLGLADAVILSSEVAATVFVIESGRNSVRSVQTALSRLAQPGSTVVGAVLLKFDPGRFGYGYGDEYGYSYRYSEKDE